MSERKPTDQQPAPLVNDGPAVWGLVIEDMQARDRLGRERYGVPLQPFNGRDALVDLYQELLDAVVYLRQEIEERAQRVAQAAREGQATVPTYLGPPLRVRYRNHRGEEAERRIRPVRLWYGTTPWHDEPQYLLEALDLDRGELRNFALRDVQRWGPPPGA
jgi:hypothetical protein